MILVGIWLLFRWQPRILFYRAWTTHESYLKAMIQQCPMLDETWTKNLLKTEITFTNVLAILWKEIMLFLFRTSILSHSSIIVATTTYGSKIASKQGDRSYSWLSDVSESNENLLINFSSEIQHWSGDNWEKIII